MNRARNGRRVTQKDVARRAGVSTSIVSYVINHGPRSVSSETRRRVMQAIEELEYRPNKHAQLLLRGKWRDDESGRRVGVRSFGVIVGGEPTFFTRPYYGAILSGIYAEAHARHMRVRFVQFVDNLNDPLLFNELLDPDEISGLLLFAVDSSCLNSTESTKTRRNIIERALARIENVVCVERQYDKVLAVIIDRADSALTAVRHLIQLGHTRIAYIGAHDDRLTGYRHALMSHDIDFDGALVSDPAARNRPDDGYAGAIQLMNAASPPTAIFACSDEVAIGVIGGLTEIGLRVPQDVALTSMDDIPVATYVTPPLTTVHVPKSEMGAYAVRMLQERTFDRSLGGSHSAENLSASVILPTELVVRASCGAHLKG